MEPAVRGEYTTIRWPRSGTSRITYLLALLISLLVLTTIQAQNVACSKECKANKHCPNDCSEPSIGLEVPCIKLGQLNNHKFDKSNPISICVTSTRKTTSTPLHSKPRHRSTKTSPRHHHPSRTQHAERPGKKSKITHTKSKPKVTKSKSKLKPTSTVVEPSVSNPLSHPNFSKPTLTKVTPSTTDTSLSNTSPTASTSEADSPSTTQSTSTPSEYKNTQPSQDSTLLPGENSKDISNGDNLNKGTQAMATAVDGSDDHKDSSNVVIPAVAGSVFGVVAVCIGLFTFYRLRRKRQFTTEREDYEAGLKKYNPDEGSPDTLQMDSLPSGFFPPPPPLIDSPRQSKAGKSLYHQSMGASVHSLAQSEWSSHNISMSSFDDTLAKFPQPANITSWNIYTIPTTQTVPVNNTPSEISPVALSSNNTQQVITEPSTSVTSTPVIVPIPAKKKALLVDINDLKRQRSLRRAASARVNRTESNRGAEANRYSCAPTQTAKNVQLNRSKSDRVVGQRWKNNTKLEGRGLVFKPSHELLPPFTPLTASGTKARAKNFRESQDDDATHPESSGLKIPKSSRKRYSTFGKNQGNRDLSEFGPVKPDDSTKMLQSNGSITSFFTAEEDLSDGR